MKKLFIIGVVGGCLAASAMTLTACEGNYDSKVTQPNGVVVRKITTIEGCRVYGVYPGAAQREIFTTICDSGRATTQVSQGCGKSCSFPAITPTVFHPNRPIK